MVPLVILASGGSNFARVLAGAWSPPTNLLIWGNASSGLDVGGQFVAPPADRVNLTWNAAAELARRNPGRSVHLITVAGGGFEIGRWLAGGDMHALLRADVAAALANAGLAAIDLFWWQNSNGPAASYDAAFEALLDGLYLEPWFPVSTPVYIGGLPGLRSGGTAEDEFWNRKFDALAARDSRRSYYDLAALPASVWTPGDHVHLTAAGIAHAANVLANAVQSGLVSRPTPGVLLLASGQLPAPQYTLPFQLRAWAGYRSLVFDLHLRPETDGAGLRCQLSGDGGASWRSSGYNYEIGHIRDSTPSAYVAAAPEAGDIWLTPQNVGGGAHEGFTGEVRLMQQARSSLWPRLLVDGAIVSADATPEGRRIVGSAFAKSPGITDAIRFYFSSGRIFAGNWAIYGRTGSPP